MDGALTWDKAKRNAALTERGLDFADAAHVFASVTHEFQDTRREYGEVRMICFGFLAARLVVVGYVQRGASRHVFSMRKANEREQAIYRGQ
jgi:uncharacterized protein